MAEGGGNVGEGVFLVRSKHDAASARRAGSEIGRDSAAGVKSQESRFKQVGRDLMSGLGIGMGIGITQDIGVRIRQFGSEVLTMGGALDQIDRKATTVFGDSRRMIDDWAEANAHSFGLTRSELTNVASGMQDVLVPLGFLRSEAAGMTMDTIGLAGALAEWSAGQFTAAEVGDRFKKALTGEREGLKELGIVISEADVKTRVLELAQQGATFATEEQAKAVATLQLISERSTDAQEAFANGADTLARKQAVASAQAKELKEAIARGLTPAVELGTEGLVILGDAALTGIGILGDYKGELLAVGVAAGVMAGARALGALPGILETVRLRAMFARDGLRNLNSAGISPLTGALGVLGIATFAITRDIQDSRAAQARFEQKVRDVTAAIYDQNGAVDLGSKAWRDYIAEQSDFVDLSDELWAMGLGARRLGEALLDGTDGFRAFIQAGIDAGTITGTIGDTAEDTARELEAMSDKSRAVALQIMGDSGDVVEAFLNERDALRESGDAALEKARQSDLLSEAEQRQVNAALESAEATGDYGDALRSVAPLLDKAGVLTSDLEEATGGLAEADEEATGAAEEHESALDGLIDSYEDLESVVGGLSKAMDKLYGVHQDVDAATIELNDATRDLRTSVFESGRTFDVSTEAGARNMEAARRLGTAVRELTLAEIAQKGATAETAAAHRDRISALAAELVQMGLTEAEVRELIAAYADVDPSVVTVADFESAVAEQELENWKGAVRSLPTSARFTIDVDGSFAFAELERFRRLAAQVGAPLPAPAAPSAPAPSTTNRNPIPNLFGRGIAAGTGWSPLPPGTEVTVGETGPERVRTDLLGRLHVAPSILTPDSGGSSVPVVNVAAPLPQPAGTVINIETLSVAVSGMLDHRDPASVDAIARDLQRALVRIAGETAP